MNIFSIGYPVASVQKLKHNLNEWKSMAIKRFNSKSHTGGGKPVTLTESEEMIIELMASNKVLGKGSEKVKVNGKV